MIDERAGPHDRSRSRRAFLNRAERAEPAEDRNEDHDDGLWQQVERGIFQLKGGLERRCRDSDG